jgi:hypothetical protein
MYQANVNPYASPAETGEIDARIGALKPLRGPSLALLIMGIVWGGGAVLFAVVAAVFISASLLTRSDVEVGDLSTFGSLYSYSRHYQAVSSPTAPDACAGGSAIDSP